MYIIITGTNRGIGHELLKLFLHDKNNKVIAISRNTNNIEELKDQYSNLNIIKFDLENYDLIQTELLEKIKNITKSVDIVINNAGYLVNLPFKDITTKDIFSSLNINFTSPTLLIQAFIPFLQNSNIKHVVNISSMGGFQGSAKFPGLSIYSATKAALSTLTECLAEEYKNDQIKFNCLALGAVNTEMLQTAFPDYKAPLEAVEMAKFIYHFATKDYRYINGKVIPVSVSTP